MSPLFLNLHETMWGVFASYGCQTEISYDIIKKSDFSKGACNVEKMTKEDLGDFIMENKNLFYHVAKSILPSDSDCADAISEMIVKGFSKLNKLKNPDAVKPWLVRILINECYNVLRQPGTVEIPEDFYCEEREEYGYLCAALYELPDKLRTVMVLYYMEGYSVGEIATMLVCTRSAVKNRLLRARKKMKELLEEDQEYA